MNLLPSAIVAALRANDDAHRRGRTDLDAAPAPDPAPVVKLFNPLSAAMWLATELDEDGDTLFGLADLGFGCPELGYFSLSEIAALRLPFGLRIERDLAFASVCPLSVWADTARRAGSILMAQVLLRPVEASFRARRASPRSTGDPAAPDPDPLPPSPGEDG